MEYAYSYSMRYFLLLLSAVTLFVSCSTDDHRRRKEVGQQESTLPSTNTTIPEQPPVVKLFIENSSSMNGYFNQDDGAKDVRLSLFNLSKQVDCQSLFFINSAVIPAQKDAQTELQQMTLQDFISYGNKGNVAASDISEVLKTIVDSTAAQGEISLLVSDFIFCPSKKNYLAWLGSDAEKSNIQTIFQGKNYVVAIMQLDAYFSGSFFTGHFDKKGCETNYKIKQKRPYYIWAIGGESEIDWFIKHIDMERIGVANSICIVNSDKALDYHLISLKGSYDIDRRDNKHAENAKFGKNGFVLDFVADIKSLPLPTSYLYNKENYATSDANYVVDTIFESNDKTHIRFRGQKIKAGNVSVYLKNNLPSWVMQHSMDDPEWDIRNIGNENRTYGLQALIEGVRDAKTSTSDNYVTFKFKIN